VPFAFLGAALKRLRPAILSSMYAPFFGLSKEPFSIAPDPRFLFMSEQHREALAHLLYGLGGGGGFVLLTGEIGAGKTTVCRCFLEQLPAHCAVAYIFNPKLTATELLQTVCAEFGLVVPAPADAVSGGSNASIKQLVDALNTFLLAAHAQGRQAVLVIDEAQSLSADVLEQLRLLTNLETSERKLLQIVLIGQPELRDMLARPELEQLAQRVIARYHLGGLSAQQTQQYIRHRLSVAGTGAQLPFDAAALARIHALSGGVPRRINLLADRALLGAYAQGRQTADKRTVQQAAAEVFGHAGKGAARAGKRAANGPARTAVQSPHAALALAATLLVGAALGWALRLQQGAGGPVAVSGATSGAASVVASAASEVAATASAAAVAASAASVATAAPVLPAAASAASAPAQQADLESLLAYAQPLQATAWRELALLWGVSIGEGDPCAVALQARLACFRSASGGLPVVKQLGRPGLIALRRPGREPVYALLLGLNSHSATLRAGTQRFDVSLAALAQAWRGDFATYWRTPPGWRGEGAAEQGAALQPWVADRLLAAGIGAAPPLAERVRAFQLTQGLPPDGLTGPLTLMRLAQWPSVLPSASAAISTGSAVSADAGEPQLGAVR